jgi:hypothetical protein
MKAWGQCYVLFTNFGDLHQFFGEKKLALFLKANAMIQVGGKIAPF